MRIGFFGNQNNYPFLLARALRARGHDVRFIVDGSERLNRPEHRYRDVSYPYAGWIHETCTVEIEDVVLRLGRWRRVLDLLRGCDAVVLNSRGMAAASELDVPSLCLATGSDLDLYARPEVAEWFACNQETRRRPRDWARRAWAMRTLERDSLVELAARVPMPLYRTIRKAIFRRFARCQGLGLRHAAAISYFPPGTVPEGDAAIRRWARPTTPWVFLCMTDFDAIAPTPLPDTPVLRLFNATRFDWAPPFPPMVGAWENKRNDVLVRGIALFHHRTGRPLDVRFVEKGHSVGATRGLVRDLGIDHLVTWRSEMTQREVFDEYARADVVSEQFGRHAVGMAGYDALAAGRPVICNWRPEIFEPFFGEAAPVAQAATPEEVAAQIERLHDPALRRELGERGRQFVERHLSPARAASTVVGLLVGAGARPGSGKQAA